MTFFPHPLKDLRSSLIALAPDAVSRQIRVRRRTRVFRKAGVVFVHVPRTAGTSITSALYGRFIGHFGLADLLAAAPADVQALPRFTVVRNPWDRLVSAWSFARAGASASDHGPIRVHRASQYAAPAFASFERFVEEWLVPRAGERIDGIFRPQHSYLLAAGGTMSFDHHGRFENLAETEAWLTEVRGSPVSLGLQNTSQRSEYRGYYTPRLRDIAAQIYARDIELLNYDF